VVKKNKKDMVVQSNHLVEAAYQLSLGEKRLLLFCIAQIRRDSELTDQVMYTVHASDYAKRFNIKLNAAYEEMALAATKLESESRVTIYRDIDGKPTKLKPRWVQTAGYLPREGKVALRFNHDVVPYLSQLQTEFTQYHLDDVSRMTSPNAIRLYELLVKWRNSGDMHTFEINTLKSLMGLDERYTLMSNFRRSVLDVCVAQINTHSPLFVSYELVKSGRSVSHLTFHYSDKLLEPLEAPDPVVKPNKKALTRDLIARKALPGETWEQAEARLKKAFASL